MNDIRWKIKKQDGKIYGPADTQTIEKWIGEQRLMPEDLVSTADSEDWKPVKDYPQFAGMFSYEDTTIEQNIREDKNKPKSCVNHPDRVAFGFCLKCGKYFCQNCIKTTFLEKNTFYICRVCGGKCELLQSSDPTKVAVSQSFWKLMLSSFVYPFRGSGAVVLVGITLVFGLLRFVSLLPMIWIARIFLLLIDLMVIGYAIEYMFCVIRSSANGDTELPDPPDLSRGIMDETAIPILQLLGTFIISFTIFLPVCIIYFPMAVLSVAMFDSIRGVDPRIILPSIVRAPKQYFVAVLFFYLTVFISYISKVLRIPIFGLGFLITEFFSIYFIMVEMNILGSFYFTQRKKLGWFRS